VLWLFSSADIYRMLVGTAGWTHQRYTAWLASAVLADPTD
jgi:hypothetical protein